MIVDYDYYVTTFCGEPIMVTDFPRATTKAERMIVKITHGRAAHYEALPAWQQEAVKEAICAQIVYYALYGTEISVAGETAAEWTVGKVHVGGQRSGSGTASGAATMACPGAIAALEQTGLLNPDVPAVDYCPVRGWW